MWRALPPFAWALSSIMALCVVGAEMRADLILDQTFDLKVVSGSPEFGKTKELQRAQTFAVGVTGRLAEVDVLVRRPTPSAIGDLILEIRATTDNGFPAETGFLVQTSLPASSIPFSFTPTSFVAFDLTPFDLQVAAGEGLAIVLHSNGVPYLWDGAADDPYPLGSNFENFLGFRDWSEPFAFRGYDLGFRTYVDTGRAPAIPEPLSLTLLLTGALMLLAVSQRTCGLRRHSVSAAARS